MHIALIVDCYPPSIKSSAKLMQDLVGEFASSGHTVTVITVTDDLDEPLSIEREGMITVCRVRTGRIKGASHAVRAINEMLLSDVIRFRASRFLKTLKPDLVVYYSPSIFFGRLVRYLKSQWHCRSYLILRDIFPEWAVEAGVLNRGMAYRVFKYFERLNYDAADCIAVQSPANLTYLETLQGTRPGSAHREVLYNWTSPQLPVRRQSGFREQWNLVGKFVFFYGGNIGVAQDMDNILRLAKRLECDDDARVVLVGEGSEFARIESCIQSGELRNVVLKPSVGQIEYLQMLQEFDAGLISLDSRLRSSNIPGKLLGYLQCGLPTLASVNPGNDLKALLEESGAGLVSLNPDDERLYENALAILRNSALRAQMRKDARRLLTEKFLVSAAAKQILEAFSQAGSQEHAKHRAEAS